MNNQKFESNNFENNWSCTVENVVELSYVWTMDKRSLCREKTGTFFESTTFSANTEYTIQWSIKVYPNGNVKKNRDYISVFLHLVSCNEPEIETKFKFSVLNKKLEKTNVRYSLTASKFSNGTSWGYSKFIQRDLVLNEENGLLVDEKLLIVCEVSFTVTSVNTSHQSSSIIKVPECRLLNDFSTLLENMNLSDVTISCGGSEIQAHKAILAARSQVFAAMFKHEMKEQRNNRIEITDVEYEIFRELLRYMYAGKVNDLERIAGKLLAAADKYALERLKMMCAEALHKTLTIETVVNVLILADMHAVDKLKSEAIKYIRENIINVMKTDQWKSTVQSHPRLINEVFQAYVMANVFSTEPPLKRPKLT